MAENTVYDYESCRLIYEIRGAVESLKKRNAMLIAAQSKVDMEKCDIEHYIENCTFNASKGYEAAMMLKECMERRRAIKNELAVINETYTMIGGQDKLREGGRNDKAVGKKDIPSESKTRIV